MSVPAPAPATPSTAGPGPTTAPGPTTTPASVTSLPVRPSRRALPALVQAERIRVVPWPDPVADPHGVPAGSR